MAHSKTEHAMKKMHSLLAEKQEEMAVVAAEDADRELLVPTSNYSHAAMVQLIIQHPELNHAQLAANFGRTAGWFASILASSSFQEALAPYKHAIADPSITATMDERLQGLAIRSLIVIQSKMDSKGVADAVVLEAAKIGIKGLGLGNAVQEKQVVTAGNVDTLAERLVAALEKQRGNVKTKMPETVVQEAELVEPIALENHSGS